MVSEGQEYGKSDAMSLLRLGYKRQFACDRGGPWSGSLMRFQSLIQLGWQFLQTCLGLEDLLQAHCCSGITRRQFLATVLLRRAARDMASPRAGDLREPEATLPLKILSINILIVTYLTHNIT